MSALVKVCGVTTVDDARAAAEAGADYIGVIVGIEQSPRCIDAAAAAAIADAAGVPVICLLDRPASRLQDILSRANPAGVQLIGTYSSEDIRAVKGAAGCAVWKTLHIPRSGAAREAEVPGQDRIEEVFAAGADVIVLDTLVKNMKGGTGRTCDWESAAALVGRASGRVFLAGGINPDNAAEAVRTVRPAGIDVSSGVEDRPGRKNIQKVSRLIRAVKGA